MLRAASSSGLRKLADGVQQRALVANPEPVVVAGDLDEPRTANIPGKVSTSLQSHSAVTGAMEDCRRHRNLSEKLADIGITQRVQHARNRARARRRPEQCGPPGFCLAISSEARREGLDFGRSAPTADQAFLPRSYCSLGSQGKGMVGRKAALREGAPQDKPTRRSGWSTAKRMQPGPPSMSR